jgi:RNA polymerase sigma-70 factor (ECF subfamily)
LHKRHLAMQTAEETKTFQRRQAEPPHLAVAIALTEPVAWSGITHTDCQVEDDADPLVARAKAGDRAALEELLAAMRPRAMATALKILRNTDDAEDAVQDAFLKIWRCLDRFEGRSSCSTWIHRIVMNASLDLLRRSASRSELVQRSDDRDVASVEVEVEVEPSYEQTPEVQVGIHQIQMLVRSAVAALPKLHRQAVELREFEDYSYQEIAETIHCPIGTVMSRLHHARNKLAGDLRAPVADAFQVFAA